MINLLEFLGANASDILPAVPSVTLNSTATITLRTISPNSFDWSTLDIQFTDPTGTLDYSGLRQDATTNITPSGTQTVLSYASYDGVNWTDVNENVITAPAGATAKNVSVKVQNAFRVQICDPAATSGTVEEFRRFAFDDTSTFIPTAGQTVHNEFNEPIAEANLDNKTIDVLVPLCNLLSNVTVTIYQNQTASAGPFTNFPASFSELEGDATMVLEFDHGGRTFCRQRQFSCDSSTTGTVTAGGSSSLVLGTPDLDGNRVAVHTSENTGITTFPISTSVTDDCLLYTSPSPRDLSTSRMPSSA